LGCFKRLARLKENLAAGFGVLDLVGWPTRDIMPRASIKFIIFVLLSLWNVWESTEGALAPEISTQAGRFSSSVTSEHHSAYLGIRCDPFHFGYCYRYMGFGHRSNKPKPRFYLFISIPADLTL
jgi:hypothetical protein